MVLIKLYGKRPNHSFGKQAEDAIKKAIKPFKGTNLKFPYRIWKILC